MAIGMFVHNSSATWSSGWPSRRTRSMCQSKVSSLTMSECLIDFLCYRWPGCNHNRRSKTCEQGLLDTSYRSFVDLSVSQKCNVRALYSFSKANLMITRTLSIRSNARVLQFCILKAHFEINPAGSRYQKFLSTTY